MKPRTFDLPLVLACCLCLPGAACLRAQSGGPDETPPPLAASATPASTQSEKTQKPRAKTSDKTSKTGASARRGAAANPGSRLPGKGPRAAASPRPGSTGSHAPELPGKAGGQPAAPEAVEPADDTGPKDIPMPLGVGRSAQTLKIPQLNAAGQILTLIMAAKATRTDQEHLQMKEMKMDFYQPDGKEDIHVVLPASTLNLKTHIISSNDPVEVRTADFELTGDKMEFNTLDRTGALTGHVRMTIHNLKKVAAVPEPPAAHE